MKRKIYVENHYEEPSESISKTKEPLPPLGQSFKEHLNDIVSRNAAKPLRFLSMRLNVYNTNSEKGDDNDGVLTTIQESSTSNIKSRTQSERVPRIKRYDRKAY